MSKTNELNFDALAHEPSVDPDIEKIFDMEFRRRFGELINQIREPSMQTWDAGSSVFHRDDPLPEIRNQASKDINYEDVEPPDPSGY